MPNASASIIQDKSRLAIMHRLELLDSPMEEAFDRLTRLASKIIGAPVSLVSLVDSDRQFFKSALGLPEPWASKRETPLSHSFCQHVVATNQPMVITDARQHPLVHDNLAIPDLDVIAYLGIPLTTQSGAGLGSFCVIDNHPRTWTPEEIEIMHDLAHSVMTEVELRAELTARRDAEKAMSEAYIKLDLRGQQLGRLIEFCRFTIDHLIGVVQHDGNKRELLDYLSLAQRELDRRVTDIGSASAGIAAQKLA